MLKITHKKEKEMIEVSIEDETNHLGMKFIAPQSDFTNEEGLDKIFGAIENYINADYISMHEKTLNGVKYIDAARKNIQWS